MARVCEICGKRPMSGHRVSHAHNLTKRRWLPNLQRVHAMVNGVRRRIRVCTRCIRSGKVTKVASQPQKNLTAEAQSTRS